ncbi:MAG: hypothetical protein MRJ68_19110 [Nitrospira sp.]|nr:hypothetical protein [Nitrospira sp.]
MEWLSSPIVSLISLLIGFTALVLGAVFYFKGKRDKEPSWSSWTVNLFKDYSGTVEDLEVRYLGEKVKNLSISNVLFWNAGRQTIHASDITEADPLRLELQDKGRILSATLIAMNNQASRPLLSRPVGERDRVLISFDYLDREHGFVVRVTHDGTRSRELRLKGALKGADEIKEIDFADFRRGRLGSYAKLLAVPSFLMPALWIFILTIESKVKILVISLLTVPLGVLLFTWFWTLFKQRGVPHGLESFLTWPVERTEEEDHQT